MKPLEQTIKQQLEELCELRESNPLLALRDELLANLPEQYANDVCILVARCTERQDVLANDIKVAEARVKQAVLSYGDSVSTSTVSALLVGGRTSWDGKRLSGYAVAHPEILEFQSKGSPYVTLRFK